MMRKSIQVVLAHADKGFCRSVAQAMEHRSDMRCAGSTHQADETIQTVANVRPDLLVVGHDNPDFDGITICRELTSRRERPRIVMVAEGDDTLVEKAVNSGVDYFLLKPVSLDQLMKRMHQIALPKHRTGPKEFAPGRFSAEEKVSACLKQIGMPSHFKGYRYLIDAATHVALEPSLMNAITTQLYPAIASLHQTRAICVERAIRHAIEMTWTNGHLEAINGLFGYAVDAYKGKPTNSSFIALISDRVRLELKLGEG